MSISKRSRLEFPRALLVPHGRGHASLAAALAVTLSAADCALPDVGARPFDPGERLTYDIEALGVTRARRSRSRSSRARARRSRSRRACASACHSRGVRGSARSLIDGRSLRGRHYRDESNDGTSASTDAQLDRDGLATRVYWANGSKSGMTAFLENGAVLDVVSALYFLRAASLPGGRFCFDAVGGSTYWRVSGHAAGTERIRTPCRPLRGATARRRGGESRRSFAPVPDPLLDQRRPPPSAGAPLRRDEPRAGRGCASHMALAGRRGDRFEHHGTLCVPARSRVSPGPCGIIPAESTRVKESHLDDEEDHARRARSR